MKQRPIDLAGAARNKRLRAKLAEAGGRAITVRLSPEAAQALDALATDRSKNQAVCDALVALADVNANTSRLAPATPQA